MKSLIHYHLKRKLSAKTQVSTRKKYQDVELSLGKHLNSKFKFTNTFLMLDCFLFS